MSVDNNATAAPTGAPETDRDGGEFLPPTVSAWLTAGCEGPAPWTEWLRASCDAHALPAPVAQALVERLPALVEGVAAGRALPPLAQLADDLPAACRTGVGVAALAVAGLPPLGAGAAWCLGLPAWVTGEAPPHQVRGAGLAVALLADATHLLAASLAPDEARAPDGLLLQALRARPGRRQDVALLTAGRLEGPRRMLELRAALGAASWRADLDAVQQASLAPLGDASPLSTALRAGWRRTRSVAAFTAMATSDAACGPSPASVVADQAAAIAWIDSDPEHRRSWEHQHWGLAGDSEPRVGSFYIRGVILECLHLAGSASAGDRIRALLSAQPCVPLRYYGADFHRVPPDCDSLGLALWLAARHGGATRDQRTAWLSVLRPSLRDDGTVPTWLLHGPAGPTTPQPRWSFGGDDCTASRAMALRGLLADDPVGHAPTVDANLPGILAAMERPGDGGSFYYARPTADRIVADLARELVRLQPGHAQGEQAIALLQTLQARALDEQQADGGWGSPLASAERLRLLADHDGASVAQSRGLRYLVERQNPDGSWETESYFLTLGKPPFAVHAIGGTELTTALCLAGIVAARPTGEA